MRLKKETYKELGKTSLALMVAHVVFLMLQPFSKGNTDSKKLAVGSVLVFLFLVVGVILLERGGNE